MDDIVNSLQVQASTMEKDLDDWKCELSLHRDRFYELNYFTTPQLLSLREELGQFKGSEILAKPVKQEVMTLLQCISRHLSSDSVKNEVQTVNGLLAEQWLLHEQNSRGKPSQSYSSDNEPPMRLPSDNSNTLSVGMDHNMSTPAAEQHTNRETIENRAASIPGAKLVAEVLKTSSGPQPKLTDEDLTDQQKVIIDNLKEMCGYSRKLILLAFERCARPDIEEAVMNWCNYNQGNFDFTDSDAGSDAATEQYECDEDEEMQSEEENMETDDSRFDEDKALHEASPPPAFAASDPYSTLEEQKVRPLEAWTPPPPLPHSSSHHSSSRPVSHPASKLKVVNREPISEDHPIVSALIDSGFSPEESFAAAEQYPDNLKRAMASLMEGPSESGELFPRAMYDDSVTIERQDSIEEYGRQISADSNEEE